MSYRKFVIAAAVAGALLTSFSPTFAKEEAPPEGAAAAALASNLAQYGTMHKDPAALLAAAHIMNGLKANVSKPTETAAGAKPASYDPLALLKLAKSYATGANASLAAAIDGEMKAVSSTQYTCYYQYYYYYGVLYYRYVCY